MSNQTGIGEKLKSYLKHPGSFIVMLLVMLRLWLKLVRLLKAQPSVGVWKTLGAQILQTRATSQ